MQDQTEVVRFLSDPESHGGAPVEVVETHGALVFLAGGEAYKIKRAVRYDYMDLSTPELRHRMLLRELELNRATAPGIYRDVLPLTRESGGLALGGGGEPVEWVLRMWRFPAEDELLAVAERGGLDDDLAGRLGRAVAGYHRAAPRREACGAQLIEDILAELSRVFAGMEDALGSERIVRFGRQAHALLHRLAPLLRARAAEGRVRRCHGDLHLRNLVLIDGEPVPFDALEFDETLGTCDILYDFAFLLMDLDHRGLTRAAGVALGAWLLEAAGEEDAGLAALPLFLAVRAAIRAMVLIQTDEARNMAGHSRDEARGLLDVACRLLEPPPPRLVAIGGVSGSGKTAVAAALAPRIGLPPGAVHLRSDLERKAAAGAPVAQRLPDAAYAEAARHAVYDRMLARARTILAAGWPVVLDATFLDPADRQAVAAVARDLGVPLQALWLEAAPDVLVARVSARRGDASDADASVVRDQLARKPEAGGWIAVDATGPLDEVVTAAGRALAIG
ncbi:AAA family ATPase [Cereibacter azotoformans]|uniref:bifunctional aminoglycoside phosphotransferase/ATP-binding protein n=1 Tax=Cereibacter azotoformans TaxID=43057 RepID=UPI001EEB1680|nr:bifunctional aminoglycoside phosphotransferase/ATP-binding protein [Cereibacter azotoformans]ULB10497.1 AAA family ATPase [Cereibacter azotoformans]